MGDTRRNSGTKAVRSQSTKCPTAWPNRLLICRVADSRVDTMKLLFRRVYPFFVESIHFTCVDSVLVWQENFQIHIQM